MTDLFSHLAALLPETPTRILLLDWPYPANELQDIGHEVVRAGAAEPEDAQPFDVALWWGEDSELDVSVVVSRLCRSSSGDGRVIVIAPLPPDAPAVSRRQGSLPSRHQKRLREIVGRLSEAGFAFRKDLNYPPGRDSGATAWKILVARRDPFVVRSYREGDEHAIQQLFRASFHVDRALDHWRWKYTDNPWGGPTLSLAADGDGQLAAHYGGYPIPIWRGGDNFVAFQIGDTMTHPEMRDTGRGKASLLARTVRHFFSIHRDGSFGFFYGFNTGPIQRFCRWFIGGSQDRPVRYLTRELDPASSSRRGADATPWRRDGYRIERVENTGKAWDRLFRKAAASYGFLIRRDARYVDWRYSRRPDVRYVILAAYRYWRLVGWSVFLRRDHADASGQHIAWGDALFHPRHHQAAEAILAAALAEPDLAGAVRIDAWFSGGPPGWDKQLERLGFVVQPEPQGLGMIALADTQTEAFDQLGEMYTTMGDGDLF